MRAGLSDPDEFADAADYLNEENAIAVRKTQVDKETALKATYFLRQAKFTLPSLCRFGECHFDLICFHQDFSTYNLQLFKVCIRFIFK